MQFLDHDAKVLLLCEDLQKLLKDLRMMHRGRMKAMCLCKNVWIYWKR